MTAVAERDGRRDLATDEPPALTFELSHEGRTWRYAWGPEGPSLVAPPAEAGGETAAPPQAIEAAAQAANRAVTRQIAGFARQQDALADLRHVAGAVLPVLVEAVRAELPGARRKLAELRAWIARRRHAAGTTGDLRAALADLDAGLERALRHGRRTPEAADRGPTPETLAKSGHRAVAGLIQAGTIGAQSREARAARELGELLRYLPLLGVPRVRPLDDEPRGESGAHGPAGHQGLPGDLALAHKRRYQPWMRAASAEIVRVHDGHAWTEFDVVRLALLDGWSLNEIGAAMAAPKGRKALAREALLSGLRRYAEMAGWR